MAIDFTLNNNFRMAIKDGDFAVGYSDPTETKLILLTAKGDWKQWPVTGVNIRQYLAAPIGPVEELALMHEIRIQMELDNKKDISFEPGQNGNFSIYLK